MTYHVDFSRRAMPDRPLVRHGPASFPGSSSVETAAGIAETVAAICAFACGRPVNYPPVRFSLRDAEKISLAQRRQPDPAILGLARDRVPWTCSKSFLSWATWTLPYGSSALLANRVALDQANADVAVMLYVSAIEALLTPRFDWGRRRVTHRFVRSVTALCPDVVDQLTAHLNAPQAFGYRPQGDLGEAEAGLLERRLRQPVSSDSYWPEPVGTRPLGGDDPPRSDPRRPTLRAFARSHPELHRKPPLLHHRQGFEPPQALNRHGHRRCEPACAGRDRYADLPRTSAVIQRGVSPSAVRRMVCRTPSAVPLPPLVGRNKFTNGQWE